MGIEVEIKLELKNANKVAEILNQNGRFLFEEVQTDTYYNPPHKNYWLDPNCITEWFRLRHVNGKSSLNYKDYTPVAWCTEHETSVGSYEDALNILKCLNFQEVITVEKRRRSWMCGEIEVSLDEVKDLGSYIELEYKGVFDDGEAIREKLTKFLKELDAEVGEEDHHGYPWLLCYI